LFAQFFETKYKTVYMEKVEKVCDIKYYVKLYTAVL